MPRLEKLCKEGKIQRILGPRLSGPESLPLDRVDGAGAVGQYGEIK